MNALNLEAANAPGALAGRTATELEAAPDERLMIMVRSDCSETAFEELVRRHTGAAYRTALACLGRRDAAEDAVQEGFLRVIRARRAYRRGLRFGPWFYTMLRNACRDELRRRAVRADAPPREPDTGSERHDPCSELVLQEQFQAAQRALEDLDKRDREILALRLHGDLEFSEIAVILSLSTEATKKRAYRALEKLREGLTGSTSSSE